MTIKSRLLFFLITFLTFFQAKSMDFIAYNRYINKAELAIIDNNLSDALVFFDSAFAIDSIAYAQDLYNASICALNTGQQERSLHYCQKLANRGVGEDFFKDKQVYSPLKERRDWKRLLESAGQQNKKFKVKYNGILKVVDSLVDKDQAMNKKWRESGMAHDVENLMHLTNDTIAFALHSLLLKEGFLSEKLIGAINSEGEFHLRTPFDVIMIHNYESRRVGDTLFNDVLRNALNEGLIKQDYYAFIRDFAGGPNTDDYFGTSHLFVKYGCTIYKSKYADLAAIDRNRNRIGLGSLEDYAKKMIFNIQNPGTDFQINGTCGRVMNFRNKESENIFLQNNEVFVQKISNCTF